MKKMHLKPRLNDCFPKWLEGKGVLTKISTYDVPWKNEFNNDFLSLDIAYHGQHSGMKLISQFAYPFLPNMLDGVFELSDNDVETICKAIYAVNKHKWQHLWDLYYAEYNPLDNYNMETVTEYDGNTTDTNVRTHDDSMDKTGTDTTTTTFNTQTEGDQTYNSQLESKKTGKDTTTETDDLIKTTEYNTRESVAHDIFGFDSSLGSNADTTDTVKTGTETESDTGTKEIETNYNSTTTDKKTGIDTNTVSKTGTEADATQYNSKNKHTGTITDDKERITDDLTHEIKKGNIGVATYQRMYKEEIENWKWKFFNEVFSDIDDMLCLKVY